jgi:hypothetical protein
MVAESNSSMMGATAFMAIDLKAVQRSFTDY